MLFRKKIEKSCAYCTHGVKVDNEQVLCSKKGICTLPAKCWRFKYDPIKRIPAKPKAVDFNKYDKEDFSL